MQPESINTSLRELNSKSSSAASWHLHLWDLESPKEQCTCHYIIHDWPSQVPSFNSHPSFSVASSPLPTWALCLRRSGLWRWNVKREAVKSNLGYKGFNFNDLWWAFGRWDQEMDFKMKRPLFPPKSKLSLSGELMWETHLTSSNSESY